MKKFIYCALAALMCAACAHDPQEIPTPDTTTGQAPQTLIAEFEQPQSRTHVKDDKTLHWNNGDLISYFPGVAFNTQYSFAGKTGDVNGQFNLITEDTPSGTTLNSNYAVYPYTSTTSVDASGVISLELPAVQQYAENSFGLGANTMVCVTESAANHTLRFKNACGYLKIQLYGSDVTVKRVELKGNNNEKIAGAATITAAYDKVPVVAMSNAATTTVTIDCGSGVQLSSDPENPTAFWFALPQTTLSGGFTITVTDTEYGTYSKSTTKEFVIDRNMIQPMAALNVECTPANNVILYTATAKVSPSYNGTTNFGTSKVEEVWDPETGKGAIIFKGDVTKIDNEPFNMYSNNYHTLTSITIPNSVTSINKPFTYCSSLREFKGKFASADGRCLIKDGELIAFAPAGITEYTIPEGVTKIGSNAFFLSSGNKNLEKINIPEGVQFINKGAFSKCTKLTTINIPQSVTTTMSNAFNGCTSLPVVENIRYADTFLIEVTDKEQSSYSIEKGTRIIGDNAFENCTSLKRINIPSGVEIIGKNAFDQCKALSSISIPEGVESIGYQAFRMCNALTVVVLPESITYIGSNAFENCLKLGAVYCMSSTVPTAKEEIFLDTDNISLSANGGRIYVPTESVSAYNMASGWKSYSLAIVGFDYDASPANNEIWYTSTAKVEPGCTAMEFGGAQILTNVWDSKTGKGVITFDREVMSLNFAFHGIEGSDAMTEISLPYSVYSFGSYAFYNCSSLAKVNMPISLTSIGSSAFRGCSSLKEVTIPVGVSSVGDGAFMCGNLSTVYCEPLSPPTAGNNIFNTSNYFQRLSIYVRKESAYKADTGWSSYSSYIKNYEF